ncbi:hypothetical protein AKJ52_00365 [candidate division MSBL1 archaeon SCGC-AAA382C18]|uniref:Uncharacterized protein n=1 Tax=candidate division MSBL1 archaeon SCGC-AAA382C18 TaxID=1698281 RepID=A0A133VLT1_9EURY|nr:hypothetical protein AKJ52_00365 [candidate division MSBL1 archaeon SCGC-AAA382C18]
MVEGQPGKEWSKAYGGSKDEWANSIVQTEDGGYVILGTTRSYGAGGSDFWLVKTDSMGNMEWTKTYGGEENEWARSIVCTSDGGYAIAGGTTSFGDGGDFWLVKTDSYGYKEWSKTYGGSDLEQANSLIQTSDDGYVIAGTTGSFGAGARDFWFIRVDSKGNKKWSKRFSIDEKKLFTIEQNVDNIVEDLNNGSISEEVENKFKEEGYQLSSPVLFVENDNKKWKVSDGDIDYVVEKEGDLLIVRDGSIEDIVEDLNNGSIPKEVLDKFEKEGYQLSNPTLSVTEKNRKWKVSDGDVDYIIERDPAGLKIYGWSKTYGGSESWEESRTIIHTNDDGYAIAGETFSKQRDFRLVKTDSQGNKEWSETYGGTRWDQPRSLVQVGGGFAIVGETKSYGVGKTDFLIVKTDSMGQKEWIETYGGPGWERARSIVKIGYSGYLIAGETSSYGSGKDFWLVRIDSQGNKEWSETYGGSDLERAHSLIRADDGFAIVGTTKTYGAGGKDIWFVKTGSSVVSDGGEGNGSVSTGPSSLFGGLPLKWTGLGIGILIAIILAIVYKKTSSGEEKEEEAREQKQKTETEQKKSEKNTSKQTQLQSKLKNICQRCGKEIYIDIDICPNCGKEINKEEE